MVDTVHSENMAASVLALFNKEMIMRLFAIFILISFLLAPAMLQAGPFGTRMGQPKEEFENLQKINSDKPGLESYITTKLPKRHSLFKNYILEFGQNGLISIVGSSEIFTNDRAAQAARNAYDNVKKQLTEKYGTPVVYERVNPDGLWKKDSEFAMSLLKHDRQHGCEWTKNLPDDLKLIRLMILPESSDKVTVAVYYQYKNIEESQKAQEEMEKDSL